MKKYTLIILFCLVYILGNSQNIVVESGSPAAITESSIDLILSDPTSFGYVSGSSTYSVTIEGGSGTPTAYYSSIHSFTMTNIGSGVYHLNTTVGQAVVPSAGTYDVSVYDYYTGNTYSCNNCFTFCEDNTGTDTQVACDSYTWIDGVTYFANNTTATHTIPNVAGCDSVVTLNLTINTVDLTVANTSPTLTANQSGATYQWLDCNNSNEPIEGETNQSFTATENGSYAVTVTFNGCTGTSDCIMITGIGINYIDSANDYKLYPNPANDLVNLSFKKTIKNAGITITDITGKHVYSMKNVTGQEFLLPIEGLKKGIYFIQVQNADKLYNIKLIKE